MRGMRDRSGELQVGAGQFATSTVVVRSRKPWSRPHQVGATTRDSSENLSVGGLHARRSGPLGGGHYVILRGRDWAGQGSTLTEQSAPAESIARDGMAFPSSPPKWVAQDSPGRSPGNHSCLRFNPRASPWAVPCRPFAPKTSTSEAQQNESASLGAAT